MNCRSHVNAQLFKSQLQELIEDDELDINFLMSQALITISTLPFHLVNDLWRWKVFRGDVEVEDWNDEYWRLKRSIVGVESPAERDELDLDPPVLFHINQDYTMMRLAKYNCEELLTNFVSSL